MRDDVYEKEVLEKCRLLKTIGFWDNDQKINPRGWLENFEEEDRAIAVYLLDRFQYYSQEMTNSLFLSAFNSLTDGSSKGPAAPNSGEIALALQNAVLAPVQGEDPNPTDSGYLFCRAARQVLDIPQSLIKSPSEAIGLVANGKNIVFVDDFIGSGDQFIYTWTRRYRASPPYTFQEAVRASGAKAIYVSILSTSKGKERINAEAEEVALSVSHVMDDRLSIFDENIPLEQKQKIQKFLEKYSPFLEPRDDYIARNPRFKQFGYKELGLMFGFSHSIPDATLPIYWSPGSGDWSPLIERR